MQRKLDVRVDLVELERGLDLMSWRDPLYKVVKRALQKRGWWKAKARGNPAKGFAMAEAKRQSRGLASVTGNAEGNGNGNHTA